jgi:hypothetical protein
VASLCQPTDLKGNPRIGLGVHHGIIVKNNPINLIDPWGLCTDASVNWGQVVGGFITIAGGLANVGLGAGLVVVAAGEASSVWGITAVSHTLGLGGTLIGTGIYEIYVGSRLIIQGGSAGGD